MIVGSPMTAGTDPSSNDRVLGALCYLFVPLGSLIVLISNEYKDRPFLRFHAIQAVGFFGAITAYALVMFIAFFVITVVTLGLGVCCAWVLFILPIVLSLYYAYLAAQDMYFEIPWLTDFMVEQGWLTRPWRSDDSLSQ